MSIVFYGQEQPLQGWSRLVNISSPIYQQLVESKSTIARFYFPALIYRLNLHTMIAKTSHWLNLFCV